MLKGFVNLGELITDISWVNGFLRGLVGDRREKWLIRKRGLVKTRRHKRTLRLRGIKVKEIGGRERRGGEQRGHLWG